MSLSGTRSASRGHAARTMAAIGVAVVVCGCGPQLSTLDLQAAGGILLPEFDPSVRDYVFAVPEGVTSATLTATASEPGASVAASLGGTPIDLSVQPAPVALPVGDSTLVVDVTEGTDVGSYTVEVVRVGVSTSYTEAPLAGRSLAKFPFFEHTVTFNEAEAFEVAFDPFEQVHLLDATCDLYICADKTAAQWASNPSLVDVRATGATTHAFANLSGIEDTAIAIASSDVHGTRADGGFGIGYDVVLDCNQDGQLGGSDLVDGVGDEAGMYVVADTVSPGPLAIVSDAYDFPSLPYNATDQTTSYPASIAPGTKLPLVVITHGQGHNFQWYDHIQDHLASYGYIVMSHDSEPNGSDKVEEYAELAIEHTDALLANQATVPDHDGDGFGDLNGKFDSNNIVFIGHSRGGGGISEAYRRLADGTHQPNHFAVSDLKLLVAIAPLTGIATNNTYQPLPSSVGYHAFVGSADADVGNGPELPPVLGDHEVALGRRSVMSIHGAGHGAFHNGGGSLVADGPCQLDRNVTHAIVLGQLVPVLRHYLDDNPAAEAFLWRQWEAFRPPGVPSHNELGCTVTANLTYRADAATEVSVIDDYTAQSCPEDAQTSSSGGTVGFTVDNLVEGVLEDEDIVLDPDPGTVGFCDGDPCALSESCNLFGCNCLQIVCDLLGTGTCASRDDTMNGMRLANRNDGDDATRGVVFQWTGPSLYTQSVVPALRDMSDGAYLSFRATQMTRQPITVANMNDPAVDDVTFNVILRDETGATSGVDLSAFGGGLEAPYPRRTLLEGPGPLGWSNEFETIRVPLAAFARNGRDIDLSRISAVIFGFGANGFTAQGHIGLTEIEIVNGP